MNESFPPHSWRRQFHDSVALHPSRPPTSVGLDPELIPAELRALRRWLGWRWKMDARGQRWNKVPVSAATGRVCDATDPANWSSWDEALRAVRQRLAHGVGIALGNGLTGIDLDHVRDPHTGGISEVAQVIIQGARSYAELSPSGTGVHVLVYGDWPADAPHRLPLSNGSQIEVYSDHKRYLTVTGKRLPGVPAEVRDGQDFLNTLLDCWREIQGKTSAGHAERAVRRDSPGVDADLSRQADGQAGGELASTLGCGAVTGESTDVEALVHRALAALGERDAARLVGLLEDAPTLPGKSPSESDFLVCVLLMRAGLSPAEAETVWRASALGKREKVAERADYVARTIARAGAVVAGEGRSGLPKAGTDDVSAWEPRPLSALGDGDTTSVRWLWEGLLARRMVTELVGLWKSGKSTLVAALLAHLARGGVLADRAVQRARALVVTEEPGERWARRRVELGLDTGEGEGADDAVYLISRPFARRPSLGEWCTFLERLRGVVEAQRFDVVVFDALPHLWPVEDENDAGQVLAALRPLHRLAEAGSGVAVLLVHHPRKSDGGQATAGRGSGVFAAFADIIVEFRRLHPERPERRERVLTVYSREEPFEIVVRWQGGADYALVGGRADAAQADRLAVVRALLADGPLTEEEILARWGEETGEVPRPGRATLRRDLAAACRAGKVTRGGEGTRGNPYRYRWAVGESEIRF